MLKISTEQYDIWETGSVLVHNNETIIFKLTDDYDVDKKFPGYSEELNIKCVFTSDSNIDSPTTSIEVVSEDTAMITFCNFDKGLSGVSNSRPFLIGIVNDRNLYLSYRIYGLTESSMKIFYYTWYLGAVAKKNE
ncbi:hypothetical protein PAECIP111893_00280 [Paenibacillus plantiphilus]|uniref:Uncharacterized protein n=1 Tax=Paenibacillus plantiphilus TaxID=2905650 RepID=A0ABN8FQL1_9BACL|nr:hypothetical protein [Paenibacillus plantiphilus]CAH1190333.1 hypothetical protein PAECIP111893_00280 [Paenibacillus plantiphilus]